MDFISYIAEEIDMATSITAPSVPMIIPCEEQAHKIEFNILGYVDKHCCFIAA